MSEKECDWNDLVLDEACILINTNDQPDYNATLYSLSSDCILCPYSKVSSIQPGRNTSIKVNTARSITWRVYNDSGYQDFRPTSDESGLVCQFQPNLGEYGIYELTVDEQGCEFDAIVEPSNSYTPLAIIFGTVLGLLLAFSFTRICTNLLRKKLKKRKTDDIHGNNAAVIVSSAGKKRRVLSIDTFRGISILTMIFVNNGAGGYAFLEHATWNGLLIGDLVFPSFVWIMGICVPISLSSQLARGISRFSIARGILKRSVILFLIDVSLNTLATDADLKKMRIFGVLQRFAVAYFVIGILYTFSMRRKYEDSEQQQQQQRQKFADFLPLLPQWIVILAITALHCGITFYLPIPGCPTGYLGPGGRHADGQYWNCTGGAAGYIDKTLLGTNHLYQRPAIDQVYGSGPFDPEGILGCLTTIVQTFLGVQTGRILRVRRGWKNRVPKWLILALICASLGCALHFTDVIPVNKNLWSLSFVFLTTSFALVLFTVCYLLVDVTGIWRGGPFRISGMNALVMYAGHKMCHQIFPFHWKYGNMRSHTWQTVAALWDVAAWTIVAYILHRKRIYISL